MSDDITKNKAWCPIPWVTYSVNSLGQYRLCVQANSYKPPNDRWQRKGSMGMFTRGTLWESNNSATKDNKPLSCQTTTLDEMRNNDFLKDVRSHMLRGERHPVCKRCNQEDDNGIKSRRMAHRDLHENDGFTIKKAFEFTEEDGTIPDIKKVPLLAADIRLSNLCNQKCRMCYPGESSSWYQEWYDTFQYRHIVYEGVQSKKLPKFTGPGNTKMTIALDDNKKAKILNYQVQDNEDSLNARVLIDVNGDPYDWTDNESMFKKLYAESPNINHIHMSGGEPLMITQHYEFLQGYVDNGKAKDITLNYNTNLSNIPERALDLWQHFKLIEIRGSVDAPSKINEYIRYPSNWEIVLRNLRLLTNVKRTGKINLSLAIITTVQIYNVLYLRELLDETKYDDIDIDDRILHLLHDPTYFNITSLPSEVKDIVADKIRLMQDETGLFIKQGKGIINHMYRNDTVDALDQFFVETRLMDNYRGHKIEEELPELYELLQQYDPLFHASRRVDKLQDQIKDAYIVNVYEQDISDLQYTHVQILRKKNG